MLLVQHTPERQNSSRKIYIGLLGDTRKSIAEYLTDRQVASGQYMLDNLTVHMPWSDDQTLHPKEDRARFVHVQRTAASIDRTATLMCRPTARMWRRWKAVRHRTTGAALCDSSLTSVTPKISKPMSPNPQHFLLFEDEHDEKPDVSC